MGDREEIRQPVPQADGSTDIGEVEPSGAIESAVVRTAGRNRRREPDPFIMMIGKPEPGRSFDCEVPAAGLDDHWIGKHPAKCNQVRWWPPTDFVAHRPGTTG